MWYTNAKYTKPSMETLYNTSAKENIFLETGIQSKQKNDAHAEKFAREELNLIYEDEHFLKFKENKPNEPQR